MRCDWALLVLDELCAAFSTGMMDLDLIKEFLTVAKGDIEVAGRNPSDVL